MPAVIQIRNVPDELHRRLKARAALVGQSLSDFLLCEVKAVVERPSLDELVERMRLRPKLVLTESLADAVRAERDGH